MRDIIQLFFSNFWLIVIFLLIFGGSITAFLRAIVNANYEHRLRMQEKKNEELRLRLELARAQQGPGRVTDLPTPKESAWDEVPMAGYDEGYQAEHPEYAPERKRQEEAVSAPVPVEKMSQEQEMPPQG